MKRSGVVTAATISVFLVGGAVAAAQDTDPLLTAANQAADQAAEVARGIAQGAAGLEADTAEGAGEAAEVELEAAETSEAGGEPQGFGSEAFLERHAMLAKMFEDKDHPVFDEHPAMRVHRALANGEHPTGVGEKQAAAARQMAEARQQMAAEGGGTPAETGPPGHARRPGHAGPGSS